MDGDSTLRQSVERALELDPRVDARRIGVAVRDGVVTLTGFVSSYAELQAAEAVAQSLPGVCAIADDIIVDLGLHGVRSDPNIAARAAAALRHDMTATGLDLRIVVRNGWVSVSGTVQHWYQKNSVEAILGRLRGIRGVRSEIAVHPQPEQYQYIQDGGPSGPRG